ncbi:methylmalonyl-CoA decarboxylase [Aquisphaera insulae]|uniref:methylmalonyl-CoA decarboxylase n=1 Tax=Aquisphaera insulae TaxID=2712864 RepID=UPI0013EAC487|nr:methylmalonyl-CoA decarboxylase [Aquisphaera insulae]
MLIANQVEDMIGVLTLNRPEKRNSICKEMVEQFLNTLAGFESARVRAVILRAADDAKVWSAGHDINELPSRRDPLMYSDPLLQLLRGIKMFPAPVIAMVHGAVWGGATDVVLSCDMAIGDETSSFAITPVKLGLPYNLVGLMTFMRRLPLNVVKEMFFTAKPMSAQDALKWGILNHLVPAAELESFTMDLARSIVANAPLAVSAVKEQLRILADAGPIAPGIFERIQDLRVHVAESDDYEEGIRAFKERRKPDFRGR